MNAGDITIDINTIITAVTLLVTALTPIILALINTKAAQALENTKKTEVAATAAAAKVETVRTDLITQHSHVDTKLNQLAKLAQEGTAIAIDAQKVGVDVHTLVNSNMGVQLKLNAAYSRRIAEITHDPEDVRVADLAQTAYNEHVTKQAIVDANLPNRESHNS